MDSANCSVEHPYIQYSAYSTDADIDMTKLSVPEQKQKHPVKGDSEPRKVEVSRTTSRLMTGGGES